MFERSPRRGEGVVLKAILWGPVAGEGEDEAHGEVDRAADEVHDGPEEGGEEGDNHQAARPQGLPPRRVETQNWSSTALRIRDI